MEATGLPGRSIRVVRRPRLIVEKEFHASTRLARTLEKSNLLVKPNKGGKKAGDKEEGDGPVFKLISVSFKVGDTVEFDTDGSNSKWTKAEIMKVHEEVSMHSLLPCHLLLSSPLLLSLLYHITLSKVSVFKTVFTFNAVYHVTPTLFPTTFPNTTCTPFTGSRGWQKDHCEILRH